MYTIYVFIIHTVQITVKVYVYGWICMYIMLCVLHIYSLTWIVITDKYVYIQLSLMAQWWRICLHCRRCEFDPWEDVGRSPGGGHGNPLQYSCLENPMDRGAWRATLHGFTKSRTQLKRQSTNISIYLSIYIYLCL